MRKIQVSKSVKRVILKENCKGVFLNLSYFIGLVGLYYIVSYIYPNLKGFVNLSDTTTAGLVGAFGGAAISLMGSLFVSKSTHKKQQEVKGIVTRKNVIYSPLYDELKNLQKQLKDLEYPDRIYFNRENEGYHVSGEPHHFYAWGRIKLDVRYTQVPSYLVEALNNFEDVGLEYSTLRGEALKEIGEQLESISSQIHSMEDQYFNARTNAYSREFLSKLLKGIKIETIDIEKVYGARGCELSEEEIRVIINCLNGVCAKLASVKDVRESYDIFITNLNELLSGIGILIRFIQRKFEYQNTKI
ncbi:hypothetical protein COL24_23765 [Bacillus toyonensis]|uniref:hypothetical protein n=1 Tax=Bacillus cereus group TaxID=86661 RepID=UPI000BF0DC11|nr:MULTISPECIES: hypothetical protein [Bacillus cereus group]PEK10528.1 hypothetical protein CN683_26650 [Bacillus toyonensis]PEO26138.1 hypothetical protein CN589_22170 [Bacillus toyonensis]PEQ07097.1 hypothetical protein CN587_02355 [Bacillus wiedmannii]PFX37493.1 hypothetical protein COL24_23765 [Bacillus toyonensis]PFY02415.1 hypothetical protein COL45_13430 [Bacillus toyonensis]